MQTEWQKEFESFKEVKNNCLDYILFELTG